MEPDSKTIDSFLEFLQKCKETCAFESYIAIRNAISLFSIPYPVVSLVPGKILYRTRVHERNEGFFENPFDLWHRRDVNRIATFGRANEPVQSIFYCSDNKDVAMLETSRISRLQETKDHEILTTGIWKVERELRIGHIIGNTTIDGLNMTVDGLQITFEELVKKFQTEKSKDHLKVLDLFSMEFTRDAHGETRNYLISCAFANYIFENSGFDPRLGRVATPSGILYPSVVVRTQGMNLALKGDVIEDGSVKLIQAVRSTLKRTGETSYTEIESLVSQPIKHPSEKIEWLIK